jgi:hypothetical protein
MKRLIYLKKWTIVRPSCFAPKERSALKKKCRSRYISALKKGRPRDISAQKISFAIELIGQVELKNKEKNQE